jgi:uncharacterized protein
LWGLCDGASAALLYVRDNADKRVAGLCLLNPWVRSDHSQASTRVRYYYAERLMQPGFWRKLCSGGVAASALGEFGRNVGRALAGALAVAPAEQLRYQQRMAEGLERFQGRTLIVLSGNDYTAKEFADHAKSEARWHVLLASPQVRVEHMPQADHTFSDAAEKSLLARLTVAWADASLEAFQPCSTL